MKKTINKIKISLSTLWIAVISFSSKVMGQHRDSDWTVDAQPDYWIYYPSELLTSPKSESPILAIKIVQILLITVIFIVWIVSFLKTRKIYDKTLKKKKIRNTIIVIAILILILIAAFIIPTRLLTK